MKADHLFNRQAIKLAVLYFVVNALFLAAYHTYQFMPGILATHTEIAYNIYTDNSIKINPKRAAYVSSESSRHRQRLEYADIDHTQFGAPTVYRTIHDTIGYGVVIGLLWKLTGSLKVGDVQLLQLFILSLLMLLIYHIALTLFASQAIAAYTGLGLIAFFPLSFLNTLVSRDVWAFYAFVLFLFGGVMYLHKRIGPGALAACSLLGALMQFVRPTAFFGLCGLLGVIGLYGLLQREMKRALICIVLLCGGNMIGFWLPFIFHNRAAYGRAFVAPAGIGSLESLGEFENPWGYRCDDAWYKDFMQQKFGLESGTYECDAKALELYKAARWERPDIVLRNAFYRIKQMLMPSFVWLAQFFDTYNQYTGWQGFKARLSRPAGIIDLLAHYVYVWLYLLIALSGMILMLRDKKYWQALLLLGCIAPGWHVIFFHIEHRYFVPFYGLLCFGIGYALGGEWHGSAVRLSWHLTK